MALSSSSDSIEKTVNPNAIRAVLATPSGKMWAAVYRLDQLGRIVPDTYSSVSMTSEQPA